MFQSATAPTTVNAENPIAVMQRRELKYILDRGQIAKLRRAMEGHMTADQFGLTTIGTIYYDTPDQRLIRASLEKPEYKEKLRLRSYGRATESSPVFLELKRKALGTVYKRRIRTTIQNAAGFVSGALESPDDSQIGRELSSFRHHYGELVPSCLIIYDRTAYVEPGGDLRLTIDENPRYRMEDLDLTRPMVGIPLLPEGCAILELKVQGAMPLWLTHALSEARIYKTSFSKYGEAYRRELTAERPYRAAPNAVSAQSRAERIA
jgi:hypothetical protein